jgi:hypothetical protein
MSSPLVLNYLNIHLAEYLAFHPEELPEGISVSTNSYLRTDHIYSIADFENRFYDHSERFTIKVEFVACGDQYFPYEVEYSLQKGLVNAKLLRA